MRVFLLLLLAINLLFFGWQRGDWGSLLNLGSDVQRAELPLNPQALRILDAKQLAQLIVVPCWEIGGSASEDLQHVESGLASLSLGTKLSIKRITEQATYMVYLPSAKNKAELDRTLAELRRLSINEFFVIQENTPLKWAVSLGVFKAEETAQSYRNSLIQRGLKNVRLGKRNSVVSKAYYQIRDVDAGLKTQLQEMRHQFAVRQDFRECTH